MDIRNEQLPPSIQRAKWVANFLDTGITIPGTKNTIGLDPLIGLIPVVGDIVTGVFAFYIIAVAVKHELPKKVISCMVLNVVVDVVVGSVPAVGDFFDWVWQANTMNMNLLEEAYLKKNFDVEGHRVIEVEVDNPTQHPVTSS